MQRHRAGAEGRRAGTGRAVSGTRRRLAALVAVTLGLLGLAVTPVDAAAASPAPAPASGGGYVSLQPARLLDTRSGVGGSGPVAANRTIELQVTGRGGVPAAGVGAVVLNVTAVTPQRAGYVTVFPSGTSRPTASTLNFVAGQTVPNLVLAKVGTGGKVSLSNVSPGSVQLVADVSGYIVGGVGAGAGGLVPLAPSRVLDTRSGLGASGPVAANRTVELQVTGRGGVPASGVGSVVLNVTAVGPSTAGYVTVFPSGTSRPTASSVNFVAGQTVPNLVVVKVGAGGKVALTNVSPGTVQLVADIAGYSIGGTDVGPGGFTSLPPSRVLDTRSGLGVPQAIPPNGRAELKVSGHGGVPPTGVGAVVLNVTVVAPAKGGHLTVYPGGTDRPNASSLNFVAGQTVPNLVVVEVDKDGWVYLGNQSGGPLHVVADVAGYSAPAWGVGSYSNTSLTGADFDHVACLADGSCIAAGATWAQLGTFDRAFGWMPEITVEDEGRAATVAESLSCAPGGTCASVGVYHRGASGVPTHVVLLRRLGQWWADELPRPAGNPAGAANEPRAADCAGTDRCTAVGSYEDVGTGRTAPLAAVVVGGRWSLVTVPVPADLEGDAALVDVACPTEGTCTAVGWYRATGGETRAFTTVLGTDGPQVETSALPASATGFHGRIDCPSEAFCGFAGAASSDTATWAVTGTVEEGALTLGTAPRAGSGTQSRLLDVACPTDATCVAVGFEDRATGTERPVVSRLVAGTWTTQELPAPPGTPDTTWHGRATAVACSSGTLCAAVDAADHVSTWSEGTWQTATVMPGVDGKRQLMTDVSCVPGGRCMAVGRFDGQQVATFAW